MRAFKLMVTVFLIISTFVSSYSQVKTDLLKKIQAINSDTKLKKVTLDNDEFLENVPDGGCQLIGYYKKDSLIKMTEWIGLSYGNRIREFYFKNNKLFFLYEKFESFIRNNNTNEPDLTKTKITFEGRYYFNSLKLIDQKVSGRRRFQEKNLDIAIDLLEEAKEDYRILNLKK